MGQTFPSKDIVVYRPSEVEELRRSAKEFIDCLRRDQLVAATEFLRYLRERGNDPETAELLRIPALMDDLKEAERDFAKGRGVSADKLRRKYRPDG